MLILECLFAAITGYLAMMAIVNVVGVEMTPAPLLRGEKIKRVGKKCGY